MKFMHSFLYRLRTTFGKSAAERDMAEQIEVHLELMTDENIRQGMEPKEARLAAQRKFGAIEPLKETARDERSLVWLEQLSQDIRYGLRQLLKAPGFALTCILTIALGIGACTAIFSVADKYLRHPLDYDEPERIVFIWETSAKSQRALTTPGFLHAWQTQATVFDDVAGSYGPSERMQLTEGDSSVPVEANYVSPNFLRTLRLRPILGREFAPEEYVSGKGNVVLLSRIHAVGIGF